jgi:hypothetical protein
MDQAGAFDPEQSIRIITDRPFVYTSGEANVVTGKLNVIYSNFVIECK